MGYTDDEGMVRVDFFRPGGKWYTTEAINMTEVYDLFPAEGLKKALAAQVGTRLSGMWAVCLEPYCAHAFPVMVTKWME